MLCQAGCQLPVLDLSGMTCMLRVIAKQHKCPQSVMQLPVRPCLQHVDSTEWQKLCSMPTMPVHLVAGSISY